MNRTLFDLPAVLPVTGSFAYVLSVPHVPVELRARWALDAIRRFVADGTDPGLLDERLVIPQRDPWAEVADRTMVIPALHAV